MSGLLALQNKFQEYLLSASKDIFTDIAETNHIPIETRLNVYSQAYRSRLIAALAANYPALNKLIGDEQFTELANIYLDHYPSHYRSIRWFGDRLESFLQNDYPGLAEIAKVEWTLTLVFDAKDSEIVALDTLTKVHPNAWAEMCFIMHPSLHTVDLLWNSTAVWQAMNADDVPEALVKQKSSTKWVFWRYELDSYFRALEPDESYALDAVCNGKTFGEICEGLCEWHQENDVGMRAASLLKAWILAGLISKIITI